MFTHVRRLGDTGVLHPAVFLMSDPLVSVCLPVYNGERFLGQAVRSVLGQSFRDFELLVFDDGSTDSSWSILETIQDPRISLRRNTRNLGPEGNWNQAMAAARGTYIKLFHQDDLLAETCLEQQVSALERTPRAALAFCRRQIIRADGRLLMTRGGPWREGEVPAHELLQSCVRAGTNLIGEPSAVLFRAEFARRAGRFDGSLPYLIDLDYWARLLAYGSGYYLPAPLASFRVSARQWSVSLGQRQGREFVAFIDRLVAADSEIAGPASRLQGQFMAHLNGFLRGMAYRWIAR